MDDKSDFSRLGRTAAAAGLDEAVADGQSLEEAMSDLGSDIMAEMAELDPNDPNYEQY